MFHIKCSFAHWIDESTSLSPQAHQRPSGWQSRNLRRTLSSIRAAETNEPTNLFFSGNHFWSPLHEQESRGNRGKLDPWDNPYSRSKSVADSSKTSSFWQHRRYMEKGQVFAKNNIAGLGDQPPTRYDSVIQLWFLSTRPMDLERVPEG